MTNPGHVGDEIEVSAPDGSPPRRGQIVDVLGRPGHERYLVRWLDGRESIHYPSDGTHVRRQTDPVQRRNGARSVAA
jgi:hypothetical protein